MRGREMARALGWFSVALGVAKFFAPRRLRQKHATPGKKSLLQGIGMREIATGVGLLTTGHSAGRLSKWMQARAGRDAIDLAFFVASLVSKGRRSWWRR